MLITNFLLLLISYNSIICLKQERHVFKITVYYDDSYDNVEDLVSYSVDSVNRLHRSSNFQFEFKLNKVYKNDGYALVKISKLNYLINFLPR